MQFDWSVDNIRHFLLNTILYKDIFHNVNIYGSLNNPLIFNFAPTMIGYYVIDMSLNDVNKQDIFICCVSLKHDSFKLCTSNIPIIFG